MLKWPKIKGFIKKFRWLLIIIFIALIVGFSIWKSNTKKTDYFLETVRRDTIIDSINETGNTQIEGQATITSSIDGIIERIYTANGNFVYTDQPLFSVHSLATDAEKTAALSAYANAQNNVRLAEQNKIALTAQISSAQKGVLDAENNYNIIAKKFRHHEINPATQVSYKELEVESAKEAVTAAKENLHALEIKYQDADLSIEAAKIGEESAKTNLDSKTSIIVKAPISGRVNNLNVNIGDKVSPLTSPVMIITNNNRLIFKTQINEIDISKIKLGQNAEIAIDALKDKKINGKVSKMDSVGTNNQGVVSFSVYINLDNPPESILSGMSGNMTIETEKRENTLTLPNAAIKPYQGGKAVQILDQNNKLQYLTIKTGLRGLEKTEILEGLNEGQQVVVTKNANAKGIFGGN